MRVKVILSPLRTYFLFCPEHRADMPYKMSVIFALIDDGP